MAVTLDEVTAQLRHLQEEHGPRHQAFHRLRDFWHGRYWEIADHDTQTVSSIFRDLIKTKTETGPDIKLVHNLLQEICVKYQTFLSPLPMIQVYIDPPETTTRRAQATKKERFLYGAWAYSKMVRKFNHMGWFLPLFGHVYLGIYPDFERKLPCACLRSPEFAYPLTGWDGEEEAVIFRWEVPESTAIRMFPGYIPIGDERGQTRGKFGFPSFRGNVGVASDPVVEVIEYDGKDQYSLWVGDQMIKGVNHEFGFKLFDPVKFIDVPGEAWGHGAVEQTVNLVEAGNALHSLVMQAMLQSVFPQLVIEDPMKFPEQLDFGLGGVIPVNAGGKASYLIPPAGALQAHENAILRNEAMVKEAAAMPDVNFGKFNGSVVTGKAISELQGAGTGSTIEMVQSAGIGLGIVSWNEKAITMTQRYWRNDTIELYGHFYDGAADVRGRRFADSMKGKELVGSNRNEVVFMPAMNMHEKIVMGLQMAGAGLVSKEWQRNQVGIPDSAAMEDELISETIRDAVLAGIVQALVASGQPDQQAADGAEQQALAMINGTTAPMQGQQPGAPPQAGLGLPPGASPAGGAAPGNPSPAPGGAPSPPGQPPFGTPGFHGMGTLPGGGEVRAMPLPMPPGAPVPGSAPTPAAAGGGAAPFPSPFASDSGSGLGAAPPGGSAPVPSNQQISLQDAVQAFQSPNLQGKLKGQVWLVGEIVQSGQTDGDLEVRITELADKQTLTDGLPQYAGRLDIKVVGGAPTEPHVEVTPGTQAAGGGELPSLQDVMG